MEPQFIHVKGAKQHNLKGIDVKIPRNKLVVITGLSGSGKSSLAFDTIYAEGQRRYVESLSAYARQFLEQMEKPDVETIEGLSPAISIEQKSASKNPRSTVGTVTEIYDYLRLLFARIGRPHCYNCGKPIVAQSASQIVEQILTFPEGTKINLLAPIVRGRKGEYQKEFTRLQKDGFTRVRVNGEVHELTGEAIPLDKKLKHTIEVFVDRLVVKDKIRQRLADSVETALKVGKGLAIAEIVGAKKEEILFSEQFACADCGISYPEITPRIFSFNNPYGACPECGGLGSKNFLDPERIIPNRKLSLRDGAIAPWANRWSFFHYQTLESLAKHYGFSVNSPWEKLPKKIQDLILYGSGGEKVRFKYDMEESSYTSEKSFEGVIPSLNRRYKESESEEFRIDLETKYMGFIPCAECKGARLRRESLFIKVQGKSIAEVSSLTIEKAFAFFQMLDLTPREEKIAEKILREINERLAFLVNVGLEYLNLDRTAGTLSGGEGQRIRLATQIGSGLVGVLYILDEPSIGLHQRDNDRLLSTLKHLRDMGNTVLVVEHDEETILEADHVIDMGPGAGKLGGQLVAEGTPKEIMANSASLTGQYLNGRRQIPLPATRRTKTDKQIRIRGAREHNLKSIDVDFPLGLFTCVTGVSGSGKSTLVLDTLFPVLKQRLYDSKDPAGEIRSIDGLKHIDKVIDIDQSPIGRTPRSNPATYTSVFGPIRDLFAQLPDAKARGYKPGRFSFNVKGGRCESCSGDGIIKIEMHFLPDIYVTCEKCNGHRYNRETLEVTYRGKSIADVLQMTVTEATEFFDRVPSIKNTLLTLNEVGLGYISLGQAATTLSGGEAQRIKLSRELSKRSTGKTLYILDEPTTGLHFEDVRKLLEVLQRLVDQGNTVIVIEHHLDVIKTADWIIDLGPEGGERGGKIVAQGPPEEIPSHSDSYTGQFLQRVLAQTNARQARAS
jgi:excinuclease ABC subunit A